MRHTMAQAGWQGMLGKSSRMFDGLLRDVLTALTADGGQQQQQQQGGGGGGGARLVHLLAQLDFNGVLFRSLGVEPPPELRWGRDDEAGDGARWGAE
jgi:hypothetical protein